MQSIISQQFRQEEGDCYSDSEEKASRSSIRVTRLDTFKAHDDSELVSPCLKGLQSNNSKIAKFMLRKLSDEGSFKLELCQISDEECDTNAGSSCHGGQSSRLGFNDTQSVMSSSAFSQIALADSQHEEQKSDISDTNCEEPKLSEAERESFFAPQTLKVTSNVFKPTTVKEFVPTQTMGFMQNLLNTQYMDLEEEESIHQPAYKQKEKTELCKFFLNGEPCKFGDDCAFAHGEDQLAKKTHVASKYKQTLCNSYINGSCLYGRRCQFVHPSRDFSDFDNQRTSYQNLLNENAQIMKQRIDTVANPDIDTFGIAMPSKGRLSIFESICPQEQKRHKKSKKQNNGQKKNSKQQAQKIDFQPKKVQPKTRVCLSDGEDAPSLSQVFGQ